MTTGWGGGDGGGVARFVEERQLVRVQLVGPGAVNAFEQKVEPVRELVVAAPFRLQRGHQFADHAVQHGHVRGQVVKNRGSVRHISIGRTSRETVALNRRGARNYFCRPDVTRPTSGIE
jgi:stage V sporulation protein SpoVS